MQVVLLAAYLWLAAGPGSSTWGCLTFFTRRRPSSKEEWSKRQEAEAASPTRHHPRNRHSPLLCILSDHKAIIKSHQGGARTTLLSGRFHQECQAIFNVQYIHSIILVCNLLMLVYIRIKVNIMTSRTAHS